MANPKRPRDPNQLAKLIVDIAAGKEQKSLPKNVGSESLVILRMVLVRGLLEILGWLQEKPEAERRPKTTVVETYHTGKKGPKD